jgi:hypothetical protein
MKKDAMAAEHAFGHDRTQWLQAFHHKMNEVAFDTVVHASHRHSPVDIHCARLQLWRIFPHEFGEKGKLTGWNITVIFMRGE